MNEKYGTPINNQKGTVAVLVALMLPVFLGMAALVLDVGLAYNTRAKLQTAVDAAALAGVQSLPDTTLACSAAQQYAIDNGVNEDELQITAPYNGDSYQIEVRCTRTINYIFAPVIGFNSGPVSARAVARYGTGDHIFDYAIFSGSEDQDLIFNGSWMDIDGDISGDVHTNRNALVNGSHQYISGALEAVGTITMNGSNLEIGQKIDHAAYVPTPQYSMNDLKAMADHVYTCSQYFNGTDINLSGITFVQGDVIINGSKVNGTGSIIATGNITINGSGMSYSTSNDAICLYSAGSITVNGSNMHVDGILYAPNDQIIMNGSHQSVNGGIIGDTVTFNGSNLTVNHDSKAAGSAVPVKVPYLSE